MIRADTRCDRVRFETSLEQQSATGCADSAASELRRCPNIDGPNPQQRDRERSRDTDRGTRERRRGVNQQAIRIHAAMYR